MHRSFFASLVLGLACIAPTLAAAGKPAGGGSGSTIRVEALALPSGATQGDARDINDAGTVVVGRAYWDVTWTYPNNWYPARWTRASATSAWQAQDLRPLIPATKWGEGLQVNDAGTVTVRSEDPRDKLYHTLVIPAGTVDPSGTIDLGPNVLTRDLDNTGAMVGIRYDPSGAQGSMALFWSSPLAAPEILPVPEGTSSAMGLEFRGGDILGLLDDADGQWLVKWSGGSGDWSMSRVQLLPDHHELTGVNSAGRFGFRLCFPCDFLQGNLRATVWDPPYAALPAVLPAPYGPRSWPGSVSEDGTIVGAVIATNGIDMLPVVWPNPATVTALPLIAGGKSGLPSGSINAFKQVPGYVAVTVKGRTLYRAVIWALP